MDCVARWICWSSVSGADGVFGAAVRIGVATGVGGSFTVTRTLSPALPPGPVAVAIYVTEDEGATMRMPFAGTIPIPGSIVTFVAFCVVIVNVADSPRMSVGRSERSVMVGAGARAGAVATGAAGSGDAAA